MQCGHLAQKAHASEPDNLAVRYKKPLKVCRQAIGKNCKQPKAGLVPSAGEWIAYLPVILLIVHPRMLDAE
jgi:hypothetical protein